MAFHLLGITRETSRGDVSMRTWRVTAWISRRRSRLAEVNHRERRDARRSRKRIRRREIRGATAKHGLFDRRRHLAGRCVSRVVELGLRKQACFAVSSGPGPCATCEAEPSESIREALIRELNEEIRVTPIDFVELAVLPDLQPNINGVSAYHIFLVTHWEGAGPIVVGDEHSEIRWFRISEAVNLDLAHPAYVGLLKGIKTDW